MTIDYETEKLIHQSFDSIMKALGLENSEQRDKKALLL